MSTVFNKAGTDHDNWDPVLVAYPESHFLWSFGEIDRMATLDERVTFQNVPIGYSKYSSEELKRDICELEPDDPITEVTPSGISVTLIPGTGDLTGSYYDSGATLRVSPQVGLSDQTFRSDGQPDTYYNAPFTTLRESPLYKKYGTSVQMIVIVPDGFATPDGLVPDPQHEPPLFKEPTPTSNKLQSVTFIIRQPTIIKRYPVSFTFRTNFEQGPGATK